MTFRTRLTGVATLAASAAFAVAAPVTYGQSSTVRGYDESGGVIGGIEGGSNGGPGTPSTSGGTSGSAGDSSTPTGSTSGDTNGSTPRDEPNSVDSGNSLPFTGLDVGILGLMGLALLGTGVSLRRGARSRS